MNLTCVPIPQSTNLVQRYAYGGGDIAIAVLLIRPLCASPDGVQYACAYP